MFSVGIKKILSILGLFVLFFTAIGLVAQANVFNPTDGTVTVMASGGTVYADGAATGSPIQVNGTVTVASVTLPEGKYHITAKAWVDQTVGAETFVNCSLNDSSTTIDRTRLNGSTVNYAAVVASGLANYGSTTTVDYICVTDARVDVYNVSLVATTVSAIN